MEGGTFYQLRNLIDRRNVSANVKGHRNEIEDFLDLVISSHLIVCAIHYFAMENETDEPHANAFGFNVSSLPLVEKKKVLYHHLNRIIDLYVIPKQYDM